MLVRSSHLQYFLCTAVRVIHILLSLSGTRRSHSAGERTTARRNPSGAWPHLRPQRVYGRTTEEGTRRLEHLQALERTTFRLSAWQEEEPWLNGVSAYQY